MYQLEKNNKLNLYNNMFTYRLVIVIGIVWVACDLSIANRCVPKSFGYSSIVCVCNNTYCDTLPKLPKLSPGQYVSYTSSEDGDRFKEEYGVLKPPETTSFFAFNIKLYPEETYQTIYGFGGAFTDATGINIASLKNELTRDSILNSYFSEDGLEYNLCRVPIGGTDFSTRAYSYNDGDEDFPLLNFKLADEDFNYKIPYIKAAKNLAGDKLKFYASAWTAPIWMKHNGKYTGPDVLRTEAYQSWADYFVKFLRSYKNEGIEFWGITTGNEPSTGLVPSEINSVGWLPHQTSKFVVENLGPTLRNSEFSNIKLIAIDDQIFLFPATIDLIFRANESAKDYIDGFGLHWYWNYLFPHSLLTRTHNLYPDKFILATESCEGSELLSIGVKLGSWDRAENYAKDIIMDLNNWVVGWVDWNMALSTVGGPTYINNNVDSPIIVDSDKQEFYKQPMYYALGHFSKFLTRSAKRIKHTQSSLTSYGINTVAFKTEDSNYVVVILNSSSYDRLFKIEILDNKNVIQKTIRKKSLTTIIFNTDVL